MIQLLRQSYKDILIVLLLGFLVLAARKCSNYETLHQQSEHNLDLKDNHYQELLTKNGERIYQQELTITNQSSNLKKLIDSNQFLKNIKTQVKVSSITVIHDTVRINNPIYIIDSNNNKYLRVPTDFSNNNKWYRIRGIVMDSGYIKIDSLSIINSIVIQIGYRRTSFLYSLLHKPIPSVTFKDSNPYTKVTSMENLQIDDKQRRKTIGIGLQVGYGVTKVGLSPYLGIGINFSPIQF